MSLNWLWNQWNEVSKSTENWVITNDPDSNINNYSKVIATEKYDENEKKITIEIPLKDWTIIPVTGTLGELIQIRKKLELEGKIPISLQHDDEAVKNIQTVQDLTRWNWGWRWTQTVIDLHEEWRKKEQTEAKRKRMIDDQKKLIEDIKNSIYSGKVKVLKAWQKTKNSLVEILLVSEDTLKRLFTKEWMSKAWDTISGIIEKWIYYAMPTIEWSLPHVKKKIMMTWKQLLDILGWKSIISKNAGKKEDIKHTDEIQ